MDKTQKSIFEKYYQTTTFIDHYTDHPEGAVDVIIPVIHTNELWENNLLSYYREIPIHRLLIGDGGCIGDSIKIAKKFPRIEVFDHRNLTSLGFSIRKLIEAVETDWFVYLHSDVYLPEGWFDAMLNHQDEYDWFECRQRITMLVEYDQDYSNTKRAYSGAQMGRLQAFRSTLPKIEDDYLYRNEDIILAGLIKEAGQRYGRADDVFHYHQLIHKPSPWLRKINSVNIKLELSREEEVRSCMMQVKGFIKYLEPDPYLMKGIAGNINRLQEMGEMNWSELADWTKKTNPAWLPLISKQAKKERWIGLIRPLIQKAKKMMK